MIEPPIAGMSQSTTSENAIAQRTWYPSTLRGVVPYMPAATSFSRIFVSLNLPLRRAVQSPSRPASESIGLCAADSASEPPVASATYPYVWIWSIVAEDPRDLLRFATRIVMPAPRSRTPAIAINPRPMSHVQFRDLLDPQRPDQHENGSEDECDPADQRVNHRIEVVPAGEREGKEYEDRQAGQDPAGDARLRRQDVHHPAQLHAPADDLGDAVEHLCRVTAGLALQLHHETE